jgi:hypothetical protein
LLRDGLYDEFSHEAAVKVAPRMLIKFHLDRHGPAEPTANLKDVLATVAWARDPGNEAAWRPVADWARP